MEEQQNKPQKTNTPKFFDWKVVLLIVIFLVVKEYFTYKQEQTKQRPIDSKAIGEHLESRAQEEDFSMFAEAKNILLEEMSSEEQVYYSDIIAKINSSSANQEDLENLGYFLDSVMQRLPENKKIVVQKFLQQGHKKFGKTIKQNILK